MTLAIVKDGMSASWPRESVYDVARVDSKDVRTAHKAVPSDRWQIDFSAARQRWMRAERRSFRAGALPRYALPEHPPSHGRLRGDERGRAGSAGAEPCSGEMLQSAEVSNRWRVLISFPHTTWLGLNDVTLG